MVLFPLPITVSHVFVVKRFLIARTAYRYSRTAFDNITLQSYRIYCWARYNGYRVFVVCRRFCRLTDCNDRIKMQRCRLVCDCETEYRPKGRIELAITYTFNSSPMRSEALSGRRESCSGGKRCTFTVIGITCAMSHSSVTVT